MRLRIVRRTLLASALMVGAALPGASVAQPGPSVGGTVGISRIVVDTKRLREQGVGGEFLAAIETSLQSGLRRAFADRIVGGRGGATLVVRLVGVQTASYVGNGGGGGGLGRGGGTTDSDYMEGVATLLGPRGEVLASAPQISALPASSGGAWYAQDNLLRRTAALSNHFAGWLRSTLDG